MENKMIDLYSRLTPNGLKLHITAEELGITYNLHPANITRGEQFKPNF
jgi:GST-like protein